MMTTFRQIDPKEIVGNPFKLIGDEWMLISSRNKLTGKSNSMTASWGGLGVLWNKPVSFCFIRPQRYTKEFVDNSDVITLNFFDETHRNALKICGTKSGRDCDKIALAGLTEFYDGQAVCFEESRMILVCRKLYVGRLEDTGFIDKSIIGANYKENDFHYVYISEVEKVFVK